MQTPPDRAHTLDATKLAPFVDPLPLPQRLMPQGTRDSTHHGALKAPYYKVSMRMVESKLHRDLPSVRLWSYGESSTPILFEARSRHGVLVEWRNDLPPEHILPVDIAPMKGMSMPSHSEPATRAITHLHGACVQTESDGYPEDWFAPGSGKLCYYPNNQDATALWCHDHAMGMNRFNIYAGLMGWYLLRDDHEDSLGLPSGAYELPLMLYDRSFTFDGQLFYPNPPDEGAWAEEFLGDAMLVNGKVQPYFNAEPRKYRLRVVNTANSRFFSLSFSNGQSFYVIGSDQGLLQAPVEMHRIVLAPSERTDIIVDFSQLGGANIELISDSLRLMQFRIGLHPVVDDSVIPSHLRSIERIAESASIRTRELTLDEMDEDSGLPMTMLLNNKRWADPVTEIVQLDSKEIWSLINLTEDVHPIHLHMVRFQLLDRRSISTFDYQDQGKIRATGDLILPSSHELGWKDVIQCPPGTVTRIIVPFEGYAGKYVWHCHLLEHEANEMMRPYVVKV